VARPPSERVTAAGATESGKTEFLRRHFLGMGRAPRLLIVDRTGEWFEREPMAPSAVGLQQTVRLLDEYSTRTRWRIITSLGNEEVQTLGARLVGIPDIHAGYSYNVGGMGLVVSEVDLLVPLANAPEELRSLWRRGSHAGLSIFADTQRLSNVSKEVTSQCGWLVFLRLDEPADVAYMRSLLGSAMTPSVVAWIQGQRYAAALFNKRRRECHLLKPDGTLARTVTDGASPDDSPPSNAVDP
jgi:hypothetical protein